MPIFYKGAGPGSFWASNDARHKGFTCRSPGVAASPGRLVHHITKGTSYTPYISLTLSFGVARDYAINTGTTSVATVDDPGFVYEIELSAPLPVGLVILDPVREVANNAPGPLEPGSYQHDGPPDFLIGVVDPLRMGRYLMAPYLQPPPGTGTPRPPRMSDELEALVRALRDAEVIVVGNIPSSAVVNRYPVY
jgi:hypothetical protein